MKSKWPYALVALLLAVGYGFATNYGLDFLFLLIALPVGCWVIYNLTPEKDRRW